MTIENFSGTALNKHEIIKDCVTNILMALNEDTARCGLKDTPRRVAESFFELTSGQGLTTSDVVKDAIFPTDSEGLILQKDIEFYSLCEHHLLPFYGHVHVAYYPDQKIIGLSKIGRLIDMFAKRLQVQENLTRQICSAIEEILQPKGVAVVVSANHFCMMMRGVKKQSGLTTTAEFRGVFKTDDVARAEFLQATKN